MKPPWKSSPHYDDPASPAPGATVLWKYRAIYLPSSASGVMWEALR